jgi:hypothetical protein
MRCKGAVPCAERRKHLPLLSTIRLGLGGIVVRVGHPIRLLCAIALVATLAHDPVGAFAIGVSAANNPLVAGPSNGIIAAHRDR